MASAKMTVGVLADTHGLLRPAVISALRGSDIIIHAGDIGGPEILQALESLAPVYAVRGNVDTGAWAQRLPRTEVAPAGEALLYVVHDIADLDLRPEAAGFAAVLFGHSHRPSQVVHNGVLHLNPGAAGPKRFHLPISVARLHIQGHRLTPEFIPIEEET